MLITGTGNTLACGLASLGPPPAAGPRLIGFCSSIGKVIAGLKDIWYWNSHLEGVAMRFLISLVIIAASVNAFGSNEWVVLTKEQQRLVHNDKCASASLEAAVGLVSYEIENAGVDYPDHLYLLDLYVSKVGKTYVVTFRDDSSILVRTNKTRATCTGKASRIAPGQFSDAVVLKDFAGKAEVATHNVLVRRGFSIDRCALEIQEKTTVDLIEVMSSIGVISIKSSDPQAQELLKLACVETVEKNGTVENSKLGQASEYLMSYELAEKYCSDRGARIPTARELAEHAISLGATGIRETKYPGEHISAIEVRDERNKNEAEGFEVITKKVRNPSGYPYSTVAFYYNRSGFNPRDPYYTDSLWSSDLAFSGFTYYLSQWGHLWEKSQYSGVARVRCVE